MALNTFPVFKSYIICFSNCFNPAPASMDLATCPLFFCSLQVHIAGADSIPCLSQTLLQPWLSHRPPSLPTPLQVFGNKPPSDISQS